MNLGDLTLEIKEPCLVSWDTMAGDDQVRFCGICQKSVHNLSAMTEDEAVEFLTNNETACVRFYARNDGLIMTSPCPSEVAGSANVVSRQLGARWKALARRVVVRAVQATGLGAGLTGLTSVGLQVGLSEPGTHHVRNSHNVRELPVVGDLINWMDPILPPPAPERRAPVRNIPITGAIMAKHHSV